MVLSDQTTEPFSLPKWLANCNGRFATNAYNGPPIRFVMAETPSKFAPDPQPKPRRSATEVIVASATEAFGSALLLWILGGVAISIAGSFAEGMIPSMPPFFAGQQATGSHSARHQDAWWHTVRGGAFVCFFAIFFAHSLWVGFHGRGTGPGKRLGRILFNLRENWFGLIVGNAISAWVAVLILGIAQDFSLVRMFWQWVWDLLLPVFGDAGRFVFGPSKSSSLGDWFSWYNANQTNLTFWFIYIAGAFDDLGVPNFKTLARWAWRRYQKRNSTALAISTGQENRLDPL